MREGAGGAGQRNRQQVRDRGVCAPRGGRLGYISPPAPAMRRSGQTDLAAPSGPGRGMIQILPEGTRLQQGATYYDLTSPDVGEFTAEEI